jgi:hypothetical protein
MLSWKKENGTEIKRILMEECERIIFSKIESWLDSCLASIWAWQKRESGSRNPSGSDRGKLHKHGSRKSRPQPARWFAHTHPVTGKVEMTESENTGVFLAVRDHMKHHF